MVTVTLTFDKEHLYFLSLVFGVILGVFAVNAFRNDNTGTPSVLGHSVGEIDWSREIASDVKIRDWVAVGGQRALTSNANSIVVGDLIGGDDAGVPRSLVLRAGDADRITVSSLGNVGVGILNPVTQLDVAGNIRMQGFAFTTGTGTVVREVWGRVRASGSVDDAGSGGWSVSRSSNRYTITFSPAFSSTPVFFVTTILSDTSQIRDFQVESASPSQVVFRTYQLAGIPASDFHFFARGAV